MMLQIIRWIVRGADYRHLEFLDDSLCREILKAFVCLFPNPGSGRLIEKLGNIEITLQLEMGPMVERVADSGRNGLCISEELVVIASVGGDISFRHSMGPHRPPLVMVSVPTVV